MAYRLKPNNRKMLSGTTLVAKIVSPDKKAFVTAEYPILVQTQQLSDEECCIRDMQTVDAILESNNDFADIKNGINSLADALEANNNGTTISLPSDSWKNATYEDADGKKHVLMTTDGRVQERPLYDPNATDEQKFRGVQFTIHIKKGTAERTLTKTAIIPMYSKEEVLAFNTGYNPWNLIKLNNIAKDKITGNLKVIFTPEEIRTFLGEAFSKRAVSNKDEAVPKMDIDISALYGFNSETGEYTRPTASEVWQMQDSDTSHRFEPIYDNNEVAGTNKGNTGAIIAYGIDNIAGSNSILSILKYDDETHNPPVPINDARVISSFITIDEVKANLANSMYLHWAGLDAITGKNSIIAVGAAGSTQNAPITCALNGKGLVVTCPGSIEDLVKDENSGIVDTSKIGYSAIMEDNRVNVRGFGKVLSFKLKLDTDIRFHLGTSPLDPETLNTSITVKDYNFSGEVNSNSTKQFIGILNDDIPSDGLSGSLSVQINGKPYGKSNAETVTLYFKITK